MSINNYKFINQDYNTVISEIEKTINKFKEENNLNDFFASTELIKNKIFFNKYIKIEEGLKKIINT